MKLRKNICSFTSILFLFKIFFLLLNTSKTREKQKFNDRNFNFSTDRKKRFCRVINLTRKENGKEGKRVAKRNFQDFYSHELSSTTEKRTPTQNLSSSKFSEVEFDLRKFPSKFYLDKLSLGKLRCSTMAMDKKKRKMLQLH